MRQIRPILWLIPGLGADARLFAPQRALRAEVRVLEWIEPAGGEGIERYAQRMAARIDLTEPFVLGGVSFGGMMATLVARHARPRALVLVASCPSPEGIPAWYRPLGKLARVIPDRLFQRMGCRSPGVAWWFGPLTPEARRIFFDMLDDTPPSLLAWSVQALLGWRGSPPAIPLFHIHGQRDRILPRRLVRPDCRVPGAGHLVNLTHPGVVNRFIERCLDRLKQNGQAE